MVQKAKYLISQVSPDMISKVLMVMRKNKSYTNQDIENHLSKKGELTASFSKYIGEISNILVQFEVLTNQNNEFFLSDFGLKMKKILLKNRSFFFEIYHLYLYYIFDLKSQDYNFLPYRSYRLLCDYIFNSEKIQNSKTIADHIDSRIKETYNVQGSFSEACITRGKVWIKELSPSIIDEDNNKIQRKPNHTEILLLGIDFYYRVSKLKHNDPLFIDSKVKNKISQSLLISPNHFDDILSEISKKFSKYITVKYNVAGTYIILNKLVNIDDLY